MKKKLLTTAILITGLISAKNYHYTIKISDTSLFSNTNTIEYNQEKNLLLNIIETPHIPSIVKSIYADEQYIYLALSNYSGNKLQIMRKSDWSIINNIPIVNNSLNKIFVDKHYIYIGYNGGGNISVFKKSDFETTNLPPTSWLGEVYSISSDDGHLYIGHRDYNYFSIINSKRDIVLNWIL